MDTTLMRQAEQARDRQLFIAFELAQRHWRLAFGDGVGGPRLVTLEAGNQVAVKEAMAKARVHFGLDEAASVVSCYEAGRDGFWLHRWLLECGVENLIVDSGTIEVNRRQRRAKRPTGSAEAVVDPNALRWWRAASVDGAARTQSGTRGCPAAASGARTAGA